MTPGRPSGTGTGTGASVTFSMDRRPDKKRRANDTDAARVAAPVLAPAIIKRVYRVTEDDIGLPQQDDYFLVFSCTSAAASAEVHTFLTSNPWDDIYGDYYPAFLLAMAQVDLADEAEADDGGDLDLRLRRVIVGVAEVHDVLCRYADNTDDDAADGLLPDVTRVRALTAPRDWQRFDLDDPLCTACVSYATIVTRPAEPV